MSQHDAPGPRPVMDYSIQPKRRRWNFFGWLGFIAICVLAFVMLRSSPKPSQAIAMSDFDMLLRSGSVRTVTVGTDRVTGDLWSATTLPNGLAVTDFRTDLPQGVGTSFDFMQYLLSNRGRASVYVDNNQNLVAQVLLPLIPWIVIFGFIWFFVFRKLRTVQPALPAGPHA